MKFSFTNLSGLFVFVALLAINHTNVNAQVSCQIFYEKLVPPSYYYYIGNFTLINPEKVLGRKCVGVGYRLGFSHNEGKESMGVGKYDDPSSNWSSSYFSFPENPELLKTQNIPNWASIVISENLELIRKHRPNVAREWTNYVSWKKSGSQGQDDPKSLGRVGEP
jgi:hypothetical protein